MFVKERRPIAGYEEIYDKLVAKKEGKSTAVVFIKTPIFLFNKSLDCI